MTGGIFKPGSFQRSLPPGSDDSVSLLGGLLTFFSANRSIFGLLPLETPFWRLWFGGIKRSKGSEQLEAGLGVLTEYRCRDDKGIFYYRLLGPPNSQDGKAMLTAEDPILRSLHKSPQEPQGLRPWGLRGGGGGNPNPKP